MQYNSFFCYYTTIADCTQQSEFSCRRLGWEENEKNRVIVKVFIVRSV